jgi:Tfp pilus assembly protein PilO
MRKRLTDQLAALNARVVAGIMLLILGLVLFEGWMLVLRKPLTEYRQIRVTHSALSASMQQAPRQLDELGKVASELKLLTTKLSGQLKVPASDDEMVASLMTALDQSAARYGPGSRCRSLRKFRFR